MRTEREIKGQVTAIRARVQELSGFWLGEGAAMTYALEWVLGKRETAPAGELGLAGGDSERIAASLAKVAEKAASRAAHPGAAVSPSRAALSRDSAKPANPAGKSRARPVEKKR